MPLLPAYYTTTRYSRRKKKINPQKYEESWRKHNKFLKRMHLVPLGYRNILITVMVKSRSPRSLRLGNQNQCSEERWNTYQIHGVQGVADTSKKVEDYKQKVSQNYIIGQAYNKGGYQVLSKVEADDPNTGKRR